MTITQRAINMFRRNKNEIVPAGGDIRKELEKHLQTLDQRIGTVGLAQHLTTVETRSWKELWQQAERSVTYATDPKKKASLKRLSGLAEMTFQKYEEKHSKMGDTVTELEEIRSRVQQAISMIEVENNLRSVTSMFEGIDVSTSSEINLESETREIRQLLHATDGLMELMA